MKTTMRFMGRFQVVHNWSSLCKQKISFVFVVCKLFGIAAMQPQLGLKFDCGCVLRLSVEFIRKRVRLNR